MKRNDLLKRLRQGGSYLKREGRSHSLWASQVSGAMEAIPRHNDFPENLAKKILKNLLAN
ncbi:addiction module toxin, HicA family [Patescibacteria group bacterium]|nr:addiction module toxin, HicA family [Patescibacteria group bacterium]